MHLDGAVLCPDCSASEPEQPNCKTCGNADESCKTIKRKYRSEDYPCDKYEPARATTLAETKVENSQPLEEPNPELMIVKTIQGLMCQVNSKFNELCATDERKALLHKALEEIDLFEKTTLYELQKAFE